ncbi:Hypothetical predicted protein [Cloeon dipterum]|uniref:Uncharacterized protein n=1 Tax=Cloeon dipterum TaxID=197152 RepID=A0A8S1CKX2_9INSE|nr:Hypothetical predicted protein [Cloeon dipterum]
MSIPCDKVRELKVSADVTGLSGGLQFACAATPHQLRRYSVQQVRRPLQHPPWHIRPPSCGGERNAPTDSNGTSLGGVSAALTSLTAAFPK